MPNVKTREANHGDKDIALSFDEWGVWYSDVWNRQEAQWKAAASQGLHCEPWPKAPHLLEDIYTVADAVVEGSLMITLLKHCDRVRSASRAQLVNVIAPIMAQEGGPAWRQTTFYPFAEAARHARGVAYAPYVESPRVRTEAFGEVDALDAVVTWDEKSRSGLLLCVNRDVAQAHAVRVDLSGLPGALDEGVRVRRAVMLHDEDPHRRNTAERPMEVTPFEPSVRACGDGSFACDMPAVSWMAVEFAL